MADGVKQPNCQVRGCDRIAYAWLDDDKGALCEQHYEEYQDGKLKPDGWSKIG